MLINFFKAIGHITAQICFDPCNGNWISVSGASDLLDLCLCWWSKLSVRPFWSNEESITEADRDFSLAYYMKEFCCSSIIRLKSWNKPIDQPGIMFSVIHQPQGVRSTSIALVSRVPLIFYKFVSSSIHFRKTLNEVFSPCSVCIIHHSSDNEHICLYISEKKSCFIHNAARCFSCDSKRSIFQMYDIAFSPCCELKDVNHKTRVHLIMMK